MFVCVCVCVRVCVCIYACVRWSTDGKSGVEGKSVDIVGRSQLRKERSVDS